MLPRDLKIAPHNTQASSQYYELARRNFALAAAAPRGLRLDPGSPQPHYQRAEAFIRAGEMESGQREARLAAQLDRLAAPPRTASAPGSATNYVNGWGQLNEGVAQQSPGSPAHLGKRAPDQSLPGRGLHSKAQGVQPPWETQAADTFLPRRGCTAQPRVAEATLWERRDPTAPYAEGVTQHSPGSPKRTLGRRGHSVPYAEGVTQHSPGSPRRTLGRRATDVSYPEGVAQRPRAELCNAFGV